MEDIGVHPDQEILKLIEAAYWRSAAVASFGR
jgi:hypothetical protein